MNRNADFFESNLICLPSHSDIDEKKAREYCKQIENFYKTKLNESNNKL